MSKFGYQTWKRKNGTFGCAICRKELRHYGKHTAYGERSVWKPFKWWDVFGEWPDRKAAIKAAKEAIETKQP